MTTSHTGIDSDCACGVVNGKIVHCESHGDGPWLREALQALADRMAVLAAHGQVPRINEPVLVRAVELLSDEDRV